MTGADEIFVLPAAVAHHIKAAVLPLGGVLRYGFSRCGNADGGEILEDIRRSCRMFLIGMILQILEDI